MDQVGVYPKGLNGFLSASSGNFVTGNTSITAVTNLSLSITTVGHPVVMVLCADGSSGFSRVKISSLNAVALGQCFFYRDSVEISEQRIGPNNGGTTATDVSYPVSAFSHIDVVAAGTYIYQFRIQNQVAGQQFGCHLAKLCIYEIPIVTI